MNLLLGLLYTPEEGERLLKTSKVGLQGAANNYQWALIRGLHELTGEKVHVVNSTPMGTFPKHSTTLFVKAQVNETPEAVVDNQSYVNLPLIKQIQRTSAAYRRVKQLLVEREEPVTVMVYSLYNPYLKALKKLKQKSQNFQYILIVPDLPGTFGIESTNPVVRKIQRIRGKKAIKLCQYADGYVLLTEQMAKPLCIEGKPIVVVEGVSSGNLEAITSYQRGEKPTILYTGTVDAALGMDTLVKAFLKLPEGSARLCIAGAGPYAERLKALSKEHSDIEYLGYLPKKEIDALQRQVAILVNPRSADDVYTRYSFPSKTMEYLTTGVPVVMNRLPGIPEEYENHLFFTDGSDVDSLARKLQEVLSMDETAVLEHGIRASRFVKDRKSSVPQAKKVIDLAQRL